MKRAIAGLTPVPRTLIMRSITLTLLVDLFRRGWPHLAAAGLSMFLMPLGLLSLIQREGSVDPDDPSQITMHFVFVQMGWLAMAAALKQAQGHPLQLATYPVATRSIVAWYLLPSMVLTFLFTAISAVLLNQMLGTHWPVWGPALFGAVAVAAFHVSIWLAERSPWIIAVIAAVATPPALWFKMRYGPLIGFPQHYWESVTVAEGATLLAVAVVLYELGVWAVARARRGELFPELGIVAWVDRALEPAMRESRFRSPEAAQRWSVWQKGGWVLPVIVGVVFSLALALWALASRDPEELFAWTAAGGLVLPMATLIGGIIIGNLGPDDGTFALGNFHGSRPMSTPAIAHATLWVTLRSVLSAWGLWAFLTLVVAAILGLAGVPLRYPFAPDTLWAYLPGSLIAAWLGCALIVVLVLTGRRVLPLGALMAGPALLIAFISGMQVLVPDSARPLVTLVMASLAVLLCVVLDVFAFWTALRKAFIRWRTAWLSAALWLVLSGLVVADQALLREKPSVVLSLVGVSLMALAVLPIPASPLALHWNRVR